jgi:hypothetical protein
MFETSPSDKFEDCKNIFDEVSTFIDPFIGKFNLRENNVNLTLEGFVESDATKAFCKAAYKSTTLLCMIWPYGGKQKLSVARKEKDPLYVDKLLLSIFHTCPEYTEAIGDDVHLREFILNCFAKVKKMVVKRQKTTQKSPHFLKTVWERDLLTVLHWTCFSTVTLHVYMYSL